MSGGGTAWTYTYDANGMRTQRTNGTTTYTYVYNGSQLTQMTVGTTVYNFIYDASGRISMLQHGRNIYHYVTNIQGDVVAILDMDGDPVVYYTYDAWGNILSTTGSLTSTLGLHNPLRYRGYVYDSETGLYYLQSRYYNPDWGRFISADALVSTGQGILGNNMFAYCRNNPVKRIDITGTADLCVTQNENDSNPFNDLATIGKGSISGNSNSGNQSIANGSFSNGTNTGQPAFASNTHSASRSGWRVGDNIRNLTAAGNIPSWSTVRQRFWKNESRYNAPNYSDADLARMGQGKAPIVDGYSMELHHPYGRAGDNFWIFYPLTHSQHFFEHYGG